VFSASLRGSATGEEPHAFTGTHARARTRLAAVGDGAGISVQADHLICPWPAGGSTDTHLRRFAEIAAKYVGQPVLIENRPGGGGR